MKGWPNQEIRQFGKVVTGKTPPTNISEYWTGDELFVSPKDMEFDSLYIKKTQSTISEKALDKFKGQNIPRNAILYTALSYGFGKIGLAPRRLLTNQQINSVIVSQAHSFRFLYYLLRISTPYIFSFNSGIDTPIVPKSVFEKIKLSCPPLPVQRKIAAVLSAYDDLIENNKRRIAILEKMAEELYREWFVRLRFPGHEKVKIVKGVPEGWEVRKIGEIAQYVNGYPFTPEDWKTVGIPIIKIKELKEGISAETPRNNGDSVSKKLHIKNGDILFSWSGSLEVVLWNQGEGLLNQHLFKVIPNSDIPKSFMFLSLRQAIPAFACLTTGATMQHLKRKELNHVDLCCCPSNILENFDLITNPILTEIQRITASLTTLSTTRDRLLSRLMSGKIDVEELDIAFPKSMSEEGA